MPTRAGTGAPGGAADERGRTTVLPDTGPVIVPSRDARRAVAIVTGGASATGRDVARGLAGWAWPIVVVYLEHQRRAEATVAEIIAAEGTIVAVRADLTDELDVERLFTESIAAFGGVDVVAHTMSDRAALLYQQAARQLRPGGALVTAAAAERMPPEIAEQLRARDITVGAAPPEGLLSFLDEWRRRATG